MGVTIAKERMYSAIECSDEKLVNKIIEKYPRILNSAITSDCKSTPLGRASFRGDLRMCDVLITLGADVNFAGPRKITPLMWSIRRGHMIVTKYLVENGSDPKILCPDGYNLLEQCIIYGQYDVGLYILEKFPQLEEAIKSEDDYQQYKDYADQKHYKYVDYKNFTEHLLKKIPFDACPSFFTKPKPPPLIDPVIDPRENWKDWFHRVLEFQEAPMVERGELPEHLQPQNRLMGRVASYLNGQSPYPDNFYEQQYQENQANKAHQISVQKSQIQDSSQDGGKNIKNIEVITQNQEQEEEKQDIQIQEQHDGGISNDYEEEINFAQQSEKKSEANLCQQESDNQEQNNKESENQKEQEQVQENNEQQQQNQEEDL